MIVRNGTLEKEPVSKASKKVQVKRIQREKLKPTSVALTEDEIRNLKAEAKRRHCARSALIRTAIQQMLGNSSHQLTMSNAQKHMRTEELAEMSNLVMRLAYAAASLEVRITRRRRDHVRLLISETMTCLQRLSGMYKC
ncbi:hypothetical protein B9Z37_03760 [Limnohabitans parvus II-B4]|uniref:Ribbon-helix-helix protein CopG domain-containing protein n=1 Tax=Limnohabitans parvus II-B4 TaxID=1293052 RepID=A0A315EFR8_9BURK|nr:hypothetical protein B9Z37_03760 [Limnohabitans parvus II-B4]